MEETAHEEDFLADGAGKSRVVSFPIHIMPNRITIDRLNRHEDSPKSVGQFEARRRIRAGSAQLKPKSRSKRVA
jgi:hypothetical protein